MSAYLLHALCKCGYSFLQIMVQGFISPLKCTIRAHAGIDRLQSCVLAIPSAFTQQVSSSGKTCDNHAWSDPTKPKRLVASYDSSPLNSLHTCGLAPAAIRCIPP